MLHEIDLSRVDLNLLVLFEAVLRERHVGRAAARLTLSPSAVSHGLGRLRRLLHDPLFLRTPKGVVPTARAEALAEPVADILARLRRVVADAAPFDPATSDRRFAIGAPDAVLAVLMPGLLAAAAREAPGIEFAARSLLAPFEAALADLERRVVDVALLPVDGLPARFASRILFEETFVVAMRAGHPLGATPTLDRYCAARHLLVSATGDAQGYVDIVLARLGRARRVALTVPNFLLALAVVAETDLVAAVPWSLMEAHGARFGVVGAPCPAPLDRFWMRAFAPRVALMDAGIVWLMDLLERSAPRPAAVAAERRGKAAAGRGRAKLV